MKANSSRRGVLSIYLDQVVKGLEALSVHAEGEVHAALPALSGLGPVDVSPVVVGGASLGTDRIKKQS